MRSTWVLLVAAVIVGAGLRFFAIGAKGLWLDEALSWRLQQFPLSMMIERTGESTTVHPPLYFALLRGWTSCFGDSECGLRSLSAVAGVLTLAGAWFLARELAVFAPRRSGTSPTTMASSSAIVATMLVALSPLHVYLAKQVRGYTLATLLLVVSSWALLRALRAETPVSCYRRWALYAIATAAFCYAHHLALFSVAAQGMFVALYLWGPGARTRVCRPAARAPDAAEPSSRGHNLPAAGDIALRASGRRGAMLAYGNPGTQYQLLTSCGDFG